MKTIIRVFLVASFLCGMSVNAHALAIYEWVCDDANCNGDPDFTSIMSISDSAYAAGEFTGVTGNILSWTTTSGVGTGFTLNLSTMYDGAAPIADQTDIKIVLSADKSEVAELWDVSSGTNITFFDSTIGWVDFFEGTSYRAMSHGDATMIDDNKFADINIYGRLKQVNPVPEPATLLLLGTGLVGLAGAGRKKFYKK